MIGREYDGGWGARSNRVGLRLLSKFVISFVYQTNKVFLFYLIYGLIVVRMVLYCLLTLVSECYITCSAGTH